MQETETKTESSKESTQEISIEYGTAKNQLEAYVKRALIRKYTQHRGGVQWSPITSPVGRGDGTVNEAIRTRGRPK